MKSRLIGEPFSQLPRPNPQTWGLYDSHACATSRAGGTGLLMTNDGLHLRLPQTKQHDGLGGQQQARADTMKHQGKIEVIPSMVNAPDASFCLSKSR